MPRHRAQIVVPHPKAPRCSMFDLRTKTSKSWLACVFADFDSFVIDHTLCERKASAMGMSLVAKYPDRIEILDPLIEFAREELEHFHIMFRVMLERGLTFTEDTKDSYVNALRELSKGSGGTTSCSTVYSFRASSKRAAANACNS
jgi:tRNA isopentenyl-2-thiomethyl-A-37 hydroxylase MiaE